MKGTCFNWWNQSALCKLRCHVFLTIGIWQWWLTYSLYLYTVFGSNDMASFLRWREGSVLFSNNLHVSRAACVDRNSWIAMMQKCNASELVLMGNDDNQKNEIKQFYTVYSRVSGSNEWMFQELWDKVRRKHGTEIHLCKWELDDNSHNCQISSKLKIIIVIIKIIIPILDTFGTNWDGILEEGSFHTSFSFSKCLKRLQPLLGRR